LKKLSIPVYSHLTKQQILKKVLKSFYIECGKIELHEGSYFDTYSLSLKHGTRISKVNKALMDIGLALKANSCPIGYPALSEGVYKIEVQKEKIKTLSFDQIYPAAHNMYMPIALGVNADGTIFNKDLQRLPNLLIGGVPGSGKSILLHAIILSAIKTNAKIYLSDPKMVEFSMYEDFKSVESIPYTVDDMRSSLEQVFKAMENRFKLLKKTKVRNAQEYNVLGKKMRPIVMVIDEWADLILQDRTLQEQMCRIAQKGRAAGISIVLATQRPSSRIISGLIKASFSGRISLRVASSIDSRIILDHKGAEKIKDVGMGLYIDHSMNEPKIFRAPWIEDINEELEKIGSA